MRTKLKKEIDYTIEVNENGQNFIQLKPHILRKLKLKKITGSRFGSVQGNNDFCSPFQEWCKMVGLVEDVVFDDTFTKAGTIIENCVTEKINEEILENVLKQQIILECPEDIAKLENQNHPFKITNQQINFLNNKHKNQLINLSKEHNFDLHNVDLSLTNASFQNVDEWVKDKDKPTSYFNFFVDGGDFGGIPDGIVPLKNKQGELILNKYGLPIHDPRCPLCEIKTVSKDAFMFRFDNNLNALSLQKEFDSITPVIKKDGENAKINKWYKSGVLPQDTKQQQDEMVIPQSYLAQMKLYALLSNTENVFLAHTFLDREDYKNPEGYDKSKHQVFFKMVKFDLNEVQKEVNASQVWYDSFIKTGTSPTMQVKGFSNDQKWFKQAENIQTMDELKKSHEELIENHSYANDLDTTIEFDLNKFSIAELQNQLTKLKEKIFGKPTTQPTLKF